MSYSKSPLNASVARCCSATAAGASFILDVGGSTPLTPGASGLVSSMSFGGSSQASSIDIPHAPPSTPTSTGAYAQNIPAISNAGQHCPYVFVYVY